MLFREEREISILTQRDFGDDCIAAKTARNDRRASPIELRTQSLISNL